jgi:hypothetical protein
MKEQTDTHLSVQYASMKEQIDSDSSMIDRTHLSVHSVCLADVAIADKTEIQTYLLYACTG